MSNTPPPSQGQYVPNYLVQAILVTVFCCLPTGIVSIVYAAQVNSKLAAGDISGAESSSADAKKWMMISFWVGLVIIVLSIIFQIVVGASVLSNMPVTPGQ